MSSRSVAPHRDYGFFGPGSTTWKVWGYPTSMVLGFLRSVVIEELDPFLVASVEHSGQVKQRTRLRYDRTLQYFATVKFGDAESVVKAAHTLVKIHARAVGVEPLSGKTFDANDPDSQLWIHLTAWHSILYTYEVFGPGKLSAAEEGQYWEECALAAHFQTIDPAFVPRSREAVAAYFREYRPRLVGSPVARDMMNFLLDATPRVLPMRVPGVNAPLASIVRKAVISTMPMWMRELSGLEQSRTIDRAVAVPTKVAVRALARSRGLQMQVLARLSPLTVPVLAPIFADTPPLEPHVWTPAEAYAHFGLPTPREQYAELLAKRTAGAGPTSCELHHSEQPVDFSVGQAAI